MAVRNNYGKIAKCSADFTIRYDVAASTVVVGGYEEGPHYTHQRRGNTVVSSISETYFLGTKEELLSRETNKQQTGPNE